MKKVLKGTLAAAAATALLAGGMGTYATWSDQESLNPADLSTGELTLAATTKGWSYDPTGAPVWGDDPSTPLVETKTPVIVPGDTLTAVYDVTAKATGDKIAGKFSLSGVTAGGLPNGVNVAIVAEDPEEASIAGLKVNGAEVAFSGSKTYTFTVTVTLTFNAELQESQLKDVTLNGATLSLIQTR